MLNFVKLMSTTRGNVRVRGNLKISTEGLVTGLSPLRSDFEKFIEKIGERYLTNVSGGP